MSERNNVLYLVVADTLKSANRYRLSFNGVSSGPTPSTQTNHMPVQVTWTTILLISAIS